MAFAWPLALLLTLLVPALLSVYLLTLRRRRRHAFTHSSVALLRSVLPPRSRWRRHVPVGLLLVSMALLSIGAARPQLSHVVPTGRTSIILALDVSQSMCATDVDPNRISVAQAAARDFVGSQPRGTRMGLVVFSGFAQLAVAPTTDHKVLTDAIDNLTMARGTAIGAALLKSVDAIAEVNADVKPVGDVGDQPPPAAPVGEASGTRGYVPDIVVLLTDGANTRGIAPLDAVPYVVDRRVRVYTIGFGTTHPASLSCSAAQLGTSGDGGGFGFRGGFGGGGGGGGFRGGGSPLRADNETLRQIAERTGARAYAAQDASQLRKVFADLPKDVTLQKRREEVTAVLVALGALLAIAAITTSLRWSPYP